MVRISTPALVSLLAASAAAAAVKRGATESPMSYPNTWTVSTYPTQPAPQQSYPTHPYPASGTPPKDTTQASDTTCTEESTPAHSTYPQSTTPVHSTYSHSVPSASTYPHSVPSASTYPTSSKPAQSTYPASSPSASTDTTCTDESTPAQSTYPQSSPPAQSTYPHSSPSASTTPSNSYPVSSPPAQSSESTTCTEESTTPSNSYPASSPPAGSTPANSYPASSPPAGSTPANSYPASSPSAAGSSPANSYPASSPSAAGTSTYWHTQYSTNYETVTGGSPAPSAECGTVTVTVTAGQAPPTYSQAPPAPQSYSTSAAPSYSASAAPSYSASSAPSYSASAPSYTTSAAASTYSAKPQPESGAGGKRGIAYASMSSLNVGSDSNVNWYHNWAPTPTGLPQGANYVPMCKDTSQADEFHQNAPNHKYLMAFNEVDMTQSGGGAPMSPEAAAAAYKTIMMPYAGSHYLGSPAITSHNAPSDYLNGVSPASGLDYLTQFAAACEGCQVDFVCGHWYGGGEDAGTQAQNFKDYAQQLITTSQKLWPGSKVWFTEFSATPTLDKDTSGVNEQFMQDVLPWLDSNDSIDKYFYYAFIPGLMANPDGSPTKAGQTYASS